MTCWGNCVRVSRRKSRTAGASTWPTIRAPLRRCWRCTCRTNYLDQLFVAPEYHGKNVGRTLLAFTRTHLTDEIWLRCVRENEKAWRWYEREGFRVREG